MPNAESTPTILEVDFFNLLVSVEQNVCLEFIIIIKSAAYFKQIYIAFYVDLSKLVDSLLHEVVL